MRIAIGGDVHWSSYSSILRKRGEEFSMRLHNCINSINWFENLASECKCELIAYMGDFFDKETLCSEEITALNKIKWNELPHYFLAGNHELGRKDLAYTSSHLFNLIDNATVVSVPMEMPIDDFTSIWFLPYIAEDNRKEFNEYINKSHSKNIVFSHNDLKGIQMGKFISTSGFDIEDIQANCDLFINGHLHNGNKVADKVYNIGNLTGQNFSEDAFRYNHSVFILDTNTLEISVYDNPYAFNFYKLDFTENKYDINKLTNAVITAKCYLKDYDNVKELLNSNNIIESRIIIQPEATDKKITIDEIQTLDHLQKFVDFVKTNIGVDDIILSELNEVCK